MTLKKSKATRRDAGSFSPERSKTRSLIRKAARGHVHSFVQVVAQYANFLSDFLYLSGITGKSERIFEMQQVFSDCWRYLPYTRRVSDLERFLQVRLEKYSTQTLRSFAFEAPHNRLTSLNHTEKFLLSARVLGNWSEKSLKLALRCPKKELSISLMNLKCKLAGLDLKKLTLSEREQVFRVSELLEGAFSEKAGRKIEQEIRSHYHALQFKADWLEYRCELADLRSNMILSEFELVDLKERIGVLIRQQPMEKPRLADSLINQISFIRLPVL